MAIDGYQIIYEREKHEMILDILKTLTIKEEEAIILRFGLNDKHYKTLEQVGHELNVCRETISHNISKAIRKLKHPTRLSILEKLR